jgi:energy-coupling factor transporter ATP-binding protein EcfA2
MQNPHLPPEHNGYRNAFTQNGGGGLEGSQQSQQPGPVQINNPNSVTNPVDKTVNFDHNPNYEKFGATQQRGRSLQKNPAKQTAKKPVSTQIQVDPANTLVTKEETEEKIKSLIEEFKTLEKRSLTSGALNSMQAILIKILNLRS